MPAIVSSSEAGNTQNYILGEDYAVLWNSLALKHIDLLSFASFHYFVIQEEHESNTFSQNQWHIHVSPKCY